MIVCRRYPALASAGEGYQELEFVVDQVADERHIEPQSVPLLAWVPRLRTTKAPPSVIARAPGPCRADSLDVWR